MSGLSHTHLIEAGSFDTEIELVLVLNFYKKKLNLNSEVSHAYFMFLKILLQVMPWKNISVQMGYKTKILCRMSTIKNSK